MYQIGSIVVHSLEGVCTIDSIVTLDINHEEKEYYKLISLLDTRKIIYILTNGKNTGRIRNMHSASEMEEIWAKILQNDASWVSDNKQRQRMLSDAWQSGDILQISLMVKMLMQKESERALAARDKEFLYTAQRVTFSEMAEVNHETYQDVYLRMKELATV